KRLNVLIPRINPRNIERHFITYASKSKHTEPFVIAVLIVTGTYNIVFKFIYIFSETSFPFFLITVSIIIPYRHLAEVIHILIKQIHLNSDSLFLSLSFHSKHHLNLKVLYRFDFPQQSRAMPIITATITRYSYTVVVSV